MVFSRSWKCLYWQIKGNNIEEGKPLKYLGVSFLYNISWVTQWNQAANLAKGSTAAIARFSHVKGNHYFPAPLHVFNAKTMSQNVTWDPNLD